MVRNSLAITMLAGSTKENVYPAQASAVVDLRLAEKTGMTVPYNTGFLVAYGAKYILSLIKAHRGG